MYRKQIRRRRAILVALLVACLILVSFSFRKSDHGADDSARGALATALALPAEGVNRALKPVRDLITWAGDTFDALDENERLRAELAEANRELARNRSAVTDNRQFQELLDLTGSGWADDYDLVTARVVVRSPTVWWSTVSISEGSSAGIRVGDAVISPQGLAGRVSAVTGNSAVVELVTDHRSAVSARALPSGAQGIVGPEVGNFKELTLDFIDSEQSIAEGNLVVTSGWTSDELASAYPPDIPVGRVTRVSSSGREGYQQVTVEPFVDTRNLDWLQVLTGGPQRPGAKLNEDVS